MSAGNGMTTTTPGALPAAIEQVLIQGNLSALKPEERVAYYNRVCESLGLNPLTQPFDYITFQGKLKLYAKRDCTDQLCRIYNVSRKITKREVVEGVLIVTCEASLPSGRTDGDIGVLPVQGLRGEALALAYMKCETKAKRRATLAICGLGWLDESEIDDFELDEGPVKPKTVAELKALNGRAAGVINILEVAGVPSAEVPNGEVATARGKSTNGVEASPNSAGQKKAEVVPPKGEKPRETCAVTKGCVGIPNHTRDCYDEDGHTLVVDGAVPSTTDGPEPPMGALEGDPKPETPKADDVTAEWEKVADFLIEKLGEVKAKPHLQNLKKKYAAEFDGVKLHAPDATKRLLEAWNAASDRVHTAPPKT